MPAVIARICPDRPKGRFQYYNIPEKEEFIMNGRNLNISNMNGDTDNPDKTCGLTDMNCVENGTEQTASITNMNNMTNNKDKTCGITDMNCLDE